MDVWLKVEKSISLNLMQRSAIKLMANGHLFFIIRTNTNPAEHSPDNRAQTTL